MRKLCILSLLLMTLLGYTANSQEYDVFLLLGQSNMAGRGTMIEGDEEVIHENVFVLDNKGKAQPATNPLNRYSSIRRDLSEQQIGPGYSFSKSIAEQTGRKILLVVNARGGSKMEEWQKYSETGYFDEAVRRARKAVKLGGKLKAILWHHGESDSRDTTYLSQLAVMVQDMRTALKEPELPFIAAEHASWRSSSKGFNSRLAKIDLYIPNSSYVYAHDCSMLKDEKNPSFGREGQILLGERYARKVMRMCYQTHDFSILTAENHPRIFLNNDDFESLKKKNVPGSIVNRLHEIVIAVADSAVASGKTFKYKLDPSGKRILPISRNALKEISACAYAYRMTGEAKYLQRAEYNINTVCSFKDWNPSHFLDVGEMATGVAIGYDWLYNDLSEETKEKARCAINKYAFDQTRVTKYCRFYKAKNNWNQVCNGGLVAAALATYEHNPEIAEKLILDAVESNVEPVEEMYGQDGNYVEGYSYWNYGTLYQCVLMTALETALGTDFGLSQTAGFLKTGEFMMFMEGITESFNYYDSWGKKVPAIPMWYFADKLKKPELLFNELRALEEGRYDTKLSEVRLLAPIMGHVARIDLDNVSPPVKNMWYGHGANPVAMIRTEWDGSDSDVYLAIKGGSAANNHSHMDAGSFVFESQGVRWACDLGNQKYAPLENAMKKLKKNLWDRSQHSGRWTVFRYNNYSHNTITLNENLHNAKGVAKFEEVIQTDTELGVVIDMTDILKGDAVSAQRTVKLVDKKNLVVSDRVVAPEDKIVTYTWRMTGSGEPEVRNDGIVLTANGKTMYLKAESNVKFEYSTWSTEPKMDYDDPNEGKYTVGIIAEIPSGKIADFKVVLSPDEK